MTAIPDCVDLDLVACVCGHLRDEHEQSFFSPCQWCDCEDYAPDTEEIYAQAQAAGTEYVSDRFTLEEASALIDIPMERWPGSCYAVATALFNGAVAAGKATGGRVVYGHWRGFMHPQGHFGARARLGFTSHGWIDLGDGRVLDPTRWVFENVAPYLYEGPGDEYDEGGNVLRAELARPCPPATGTLEVLHLDDGAARFLAGLSGQALKPSYGEQTLVMLDRSQLFWLANIALDALGEHAEAIYTALIDAGHRALIPVDNRLKALPR